jgi:hydroxymethylbilane synthase
MNQPAIIRLATRGSALALWQANRVAELLRRAEPGVEVELIVVSTSPDRLPETPLAALGGDKGLFIAEVEQAIRDGRADAAVHSLKDVPTTLPGDMSVVAFPEREDVRDALVTAGRAGLEQLKQGAHVGTSALRRKGQLLHVRPDLRISEIRGNVDTRVRKLREGQYDVIVLAGAGLRRLGMSGEISELLPLELMLPAAGQGAIAVEAPSDSPWQKVWTAIDDIGVRACVETERELARALGADCNSAVGCLCQLTAGELHLRACVVAADGTERLSFEDYAPLCSPPAELVLRAADYLVSQGAARLLGH